MMLYELSKMHNNPKIFGGKVAGLAELASLGFNIPKTFILPASESNILKSDIEQLIKNFPLNTTLAIRSSAIGEDGTHQSFAGIFDTKLNVSLEYKNILDAINKVKNSIKTDKTNSYTNNNSGKMNIIIQQMIQPKFAGVAFTDALTENGDNAALVEFVTGLGDKLVSGRETAKRISLSYNENDILDINKVKYFSGSEQIKPFIKSISNSLTAIKQKFIKPTDIEWAIDNQGKFWFLQARPITKTVLIPKENDYENSGTVVSFGKGTVKGRAYFIDGDMEEESQELKNAINNMPQGDILVLTYSDTYYMPAMKKAAGIISTNGSILAHAAIVSREIGIPCIVGIKEAPKMFPTGTIVEINPSQNKIISEKYVITGDYSDIDWGELDIYDTIQENDINGIKVLFEPLPDGKLAAHLPEDIPAGFSDKVEEFARREYHKSARQYQISNYLWYYEIQRFKNLEHFNNILLVGEKASDSQDAKQIENMFDDLIKTAKKLVSLKNKTKDKLDKFILEETMQSMDFAASQMIAAGYAIKRTYEKVIPILKQHGITFTKFLELNENSDIVKQNPQLRQSMNFMRACEKGRNENFENMLKIKAMRPDYYDKRENRAKKILSQKDNKINPVDAIYENLIVKLKKKLDFNHIR